MLQTVTYFVVQLFSSSFLSLLVMKRSNPSDGATQPLFTFNLSRSEPPRRWRNVVQRNRFRARLDQSRDPDSSDDIGEELTEALRTAVVDQINNTPGVLPHHAVHFTMQSDHFSHAFQSATFTADEFQTQSPRLRTYLQSLAEKLNSNQEFEADDSFTVDMTIVHTPGRGGRGGRDRNRKLGQCTIETLLKRKRSIVMVRNLDNLCCARALVTMKARVDEDYEYNNLRRGRNIQTVRAKTLHAQAGVTEEPCGIPELTQFQAALPGYQIKVLSVDKPYMVIFEGQEADKKLLLVKVGDHYHGCTSFAGFLDTSYYCHSCNKGYSVDDRDHHPCNNRWCSSCMGKDCADLKTAAANATRPKPTLPCSQCHRLFYGTACFNAHLQCSQTHRSVCEQNKKCLVCLKLFEAAPPERKKRPSLKHRHRCYVGECPFCLQYVDQREHRCFIQPVKPEDDLPKIRTVAEEDVAGREVLGYDPDTGRPFVPEFGCLFIYADYEAVTSPDGVQEPILLCCETADQEETQRFYGADCTDKFFEYLDELTIDDDNLPRKVIVIFHNFKGYDGMFVLKYLYDNHRDVDNQITVGTKVLSLSNGNITFKDSLCFLPFPLASFPDTFGIQELRKGFFPHLFNTIANQE